MLEVWWIYNVNFLNSSGIFDIFRPSWRVKVWPGNQPNLTKGAPPTDDGNQYHLLHSPAIGPQSFVHLDTPLYSRLESASWNPPKKEERLFDSVCFLFGFWDGSPGKPLVTWDHGCFFSQIFHLKRDWTPNGKDCLPTIIFQEICQFSEEESFGFGKTNPSNIFKLRANIALARVTD